MALDAPHTVQLSEKDLMLLRAGLVAYLRAFAAHRELDGDATHPGDE